MADKAAHMEAAPSKAPAQVFGDGKSKARKGMEA